MASLPSSSTAFTHLLALLTGIAIGKSIDADELSAYRSIDDTPLRRFSRKIKSIVVGGVVLGLVYKTGSIAMRGLLGNGSGGTGGDSGGDNSSANR